MEKSISQRFKKGVNVAIVACVVVFPVGRHYVEITKKDDSASTSRSSELKKPQIRCDKRTTAQKVGIIKPKRASHDCSRRQYLSQLLRKIKFDISCESSAGR